MKTVNGTFNYGGGVFIDNGLLNEGGEVKELEN
jgi:hypothetical protein